MRAGYTDASLAPAAPLEHVNAILAKALASAAGRYGTITLTARWAGDYLQACRADFAPAERHTFEYRAPSRKPANAVA